MQNRRFSLLTAPRKLALADSAVGVAVGALTASGALLLEDVFPKPGDRIELSGMRVVVFAGVLVLTVAGVALRAWVRRTTGTLLSVQVLDEGMGDKTHGVRSREFAARRVMAVRTVHHWADIPGRTRGEVIEATDIAASAGREAEMFINTATASERITIAPNMLWPIALSVGGRLALAEFTTWFAELSTADNRRNEQFRLDVESLDSLPPLSVEPVPVDEPSGDRVGVMLNFTQYEPDMRPDPLVPFGVQEVYHLRRPSGMGKRIEGNGPALVHFTGKELRKLSRDVAVQLMRIKEAAGERELVVTARLPKTMAVAIGWYLAQFRCRFYRGTLLLHHIPGDAGGEAVRRPMRVHESQAL